MAKSSYVSVSGRPARITGGLDGDDGTAMRVIGLVIRGERVLADGTALGEVLESGCSQLRSDYLQAIGGECLRTGGDDAWVNKELDVGSAKVPP